MSRFTVKLVSPRGKLFEGEADSIVVPGEHGSMGVLAGHAPMLAALQAGVMTVSSESTTTYYAVRHGMLEVHQGGVVILTDGAIAADGEVSAKNTVAEWKLKAAAPEST